MFFGKFCVRAKRTIPTANVNKNKIHRSFDSLSRKETFNHINLL